ncbi:Transglycosylase SLT domain-containing protein [Candidatus Kryptobacter tengchongensis]|nr:Transglycosylase SLT domain-containing protein [Candidatus Kryptobacter tengchongensis]
MLKIFVQNKKYKRAGKTRKVSKKALAEAGHKVIAFLFSITLAINCSGIHPQIKSLSNNSSNLGYIQSSDDSPSEDQNADPSLSLHNTNIIPENLKEYLPVIKKYSKIYGFDWRLIIAVIQQESNFKHDAVSPRGAYGLLQIMPETGEELVLNVSHIYDFRTPEQNIIAGIHYLWTQFNRFFSQGMDSTECLKLALAAYNAGPGRVLDAQQLAIYFGEDPNKWEAIKTIFPLLSSKYYTLHKYVWANGRPKSGYFHNYQETVNYVDKIMRNYARYKKLLR